MAAAQIGQLPAHAKGYGAKEAAQAPRVVGAPVDGSPSAGGLTAVPRDAHPFPMDLASGFAAGHRRTRSDPFVRVFDEFREDRSRSRGVREHDAGTSRSSVENQGVGPAVSQAPADVFDVEMSDACYNEQENVPVAGLPAPPVNPGSLAAVGPAGLALGSTWERAALRELTLEVPLEYQEHAESDIESDEGDDFVSENLAEHLEERIRENAGGFYDFKIYCD